MSQMVRRRNASLHRNALGEAHMRVCGGEMRPRAKREGAATFFYGSGSRSHNENFQLMTPALADVIQSRPGTRLVVVGPVDLGPAFGEIEDRVERLPFARDLDEYWTMLGGSNINLAPLTPGAFNDAKSEIKWMEAGMLGVPSIVSSSKVYDERVRDGVDGFVAHDIEGWRRALERLADDADLRARMGAAARRRALDEYAVQPMGRICWTICARE